jgi:hypothetical protein
MMDMYGMSSVIYGRNALYGGLSPLPFLKILKLKLYTMKKLLFIALVLLIAACEKSDGPVYTELPLNFKLGGSFETAKENLKDYQVRIIFEGDHFIECETSASMAGYDVTKITIGEYKRNLVSLQLEMEKQESTFEDVVSYIESSYDIPLEVKNNWAVSGDGLILNCSIVELENSIQVTFCGYRDDGKC